MTNQNLTQAQLGLKSKWDNQAELGSGLIESGISELGSARAPACFLENYLLFGENVTKKLEKKEHIHKSQYIYKFEC